MNLLGFSRQSGKLRTEVKLIMDLSVYRPNLSRGTLGGTITRKPLAYLVFWLANYQLANKPKKHTFAGKGFFRLLSPAGMSSRACM